jgi:pyridoxamine 5'-phosphate oxidase-like protein
VNDGFRELTAPESLRRLGSVSWGRVVFTMNALPAICLVHHLLDGDDLVLRAHAGRSVRTAADQVVAYQADQVDETDQLGWSVVVTGIARLVDDPGDLARYQRTLRPPTRRAFDHLIRVTPEIVTGYELVAAAPGEAGEPELTA